MGFKVPAFLIIRSNLIGMVLYSSAHHPFLSHSSCLECGCDDSRGSCLEGMNKSRADMLRLPEQKIRKTLGL